MVRAIVHRANVAIFTVGIWLLANAQLVAAPRPETPVNNETTSAKDDSDFIDADVMDNLVNVRRQLELMTTKENESSFIDLEVVRSHLDKAIVEAGFKIRSALATLYYPVDASSTLDPRDDPKLREQIAAFQRTLGNTPDGTLTFGEERELVRLQSMAHITPLKIIGSQSVLVGEDFAKATGSWVIQQDTIDARLNFSEIKCYRELGFCVEAQAKYFAPGEAWTSGEVQFSPYVHMEIYIVTSWSGQIVEAQLQGPPSNCRISTLTLNQATKVAALVTRDGEEACDFDGKQLLPRLGAPRVSTLEDPSAIRKKFYEDIADKVERHHGPLAPGAYIRPVIY